MYKIFFLSVVGAIDFSFLSDKELLLATQLGQPGPPWATGPFFCDTVVSRRCASLGSRFSSSSCGEALPEGAPGLPAGGHGVVHGDAYNRTFIFFACAEAEEGEGGGSTPASLAARGSVLARVGASRGAPQRAGRRSVWAEEPAPPRGGWAAEAAALPALPEERAPPCRAERATRVVCAQTEPRRGADGGSGGGEGGGGMGGGGGGGGGSAPWGTRCSCLLRASGGLDEAVFPAA
jgi:hypothetical protein